MHRWARSLRRIVWILVLGLAGSAHAGSIDVLVRDEFGASFAGVELSVRLPPALEREAGMRFRRAVTDAQGRVEFRGLPAGQYAVQIDSRTTADFVNPRDNPLTLPPVATLTSDTDRASLELELWRGSLVVCRVVLDRGHLPRGITIGMRQADYRQHQSVELKDSPEIERRLVPGRWELQLNAPPGYILTGLEVDGGALPGHLAPLDIVSPGSPRFVTWQLKAPDAIIAGQIEFEGQPVGATIRARLIEPGPWIAHVETRGGSDYAAIEAGVRRGRYFMRVQSGSWELEPYGRFVSGSDPPLAIVEVGPGASTRQDFRLVSDVGEPGSVLQVSVQDPDGEHIRNATIEVYPLTAAADADENPLAREKSRYGYSLIRGLAAGDYLVVAGHADWVEGTAEVIGFDPSEQKDEPRRVQINLRRGATVHVEALTLGDAGVPGVALELTALGDGPTYRIRDPELLARIDKPTADTDATGHAFLRSIYPGRWKLQGQLKGPRSTAQFVDFEGADGLQNSLELELEDAQERNVEARVHPGASFEAELACTDGHPLPVATTTLVLSDSRDPRDVDDRTSFDAPEGGGLSVFPELPLAGPLRDRFTVGPLAEGGYFVATRPAGYQRWTWLLGAENGANAALFQVVPGERSKLGHIEVDCGPAIRLLPYAESGAPLPRFRDLDARYGDVSVSGEVTHDGPSRPIESAHVDAYDDHVVVRGLPVGTLRLSVRLRHRYFLPSAEISVDVEQEMERGSLIELRAPIADVGGALRIRADGPQFARITVGESARSAEFRDGVASLDNLPAGVYEVHLCTDSECAGNSTLLTGIRIDMLRTTDLEVP